MKTRYQQMFLRSLIAFGLIALFYKSYDLYTAFHPPTNWIAIFVIWFATLIHLGRSFISFTNGWGIRLDVAIFIIQMAPTIAFIVQKSFPHSTWTPMDWVELLVKIICTLVLFFATRLASHKIGDHIAQNNSTMSHE